MSPSALQSLFAYKAWADAELLQALRGVSVELYPMELHTVLRTMNHIHVVDRIFCAHLQGRPHGYEDSNTAETPTLPDLQSTVAATDAWYVHYVESASPQQLAETVDFTFTDGDIGCLTREEILLHIITHGNYHRGTMAQQLKAISVTPPRDLLTRFLRQSEPAWGNADWGSDE
jgi:uncharacterized damage-inducible protein DinB